MVSRVLGLVREKVIAYYFPAAVVGDAIYAAFRIPNLLRDLFAEGVLSKAFITTFTETETQDGTPDAWQLASRVLNLFGLILAAITCLGILFTPQIVDVMLAGKGFAATLDPATHFGFASKRELTITLTRIMFPFLTMVSFAAVSMGVLNSKGIFAIPAWASSFFNITALVIGVAGYYLLPPLGIHPAIGMAAGFLAGGVAQFTVQVPPLYRVGFRYRPLLSFSHPRVKQVLRLMGPAIIGAAALQLNVFANTYFASQDQGWLTWITRAFRLMYLPIGVFGVAISTVSLPNLARRIAEADAAGFRDAFSRAMHLLLLFTIPSSFGLLILAVPICRLIFEGGASNPVDTVQTGKALFYYAFGLSGYSAVKVTTDAFYAFQDTQTPVKVGAAMVALNILLNYLFIMHLGFDHRSLALSTACTINLNFTLLLILLRRKAGRLGLGGLPRTLVKIIVASSGLALVTWWLNAAIEAAIGTQSTVAQLAGVGVPILAGAVTFAVIAKLLRIPQLDEIRHAFRRK